MVVLDTNILVYAHRERAPLHQSARQAIVRASKAVDGWGIAQASVAEFWNVVTHPGIEGRPSTAGEARAFFDSLEPIGAQLLSPAPAMPQRLMRTAEDLGVVGRRIFDLQIALTALDHGAVELWTHDHGFVTVPGLQLVDPLAPA